MGKWLSGDTEMNDMLIELKCSFLCRKHLRDDHYRTFSSAHNSLAPSVGENLARVAIIVIDDHCLSGEDLARLALAPTAGKGKGKGKEMRSFTVA